MNTLFPMRSDLTQPLREAVRFCLFLFVLAIIAPFAHAQSGVTDLVVARKVNLQGITAPAAITGNVNDYAPAGFANATTLKLSSTMAVNITGLSGGTPGRVLWIVNAGAFDLTFTPQDALSLAANRFAIVGPTVVPSGYAVSFIYDPIAARWIGLSQGKSTTVWGQITGSIGNQTDLNDAIAGLAQAGLTTGVASPGDTVLFSAPNTSTLRIAALQRGIYSTLLAPGLPITAAIKSFAQQDYPLSSLGLVADGTYARWIGYDSSGTVVTSTQRFTNDSSAIGLGIIVVKRVGGVTTFIDDGGPRSFLTSPQMAQFSTLERAVIGGFKSSVTITNQSTNMTLARSAGTITGISANWTSLGNKNVLDLAAVATAPFIEVNPAIAAATSLPAATTTLTATNYWNGTTSVALTGPNNASVKRFLLGVKGGLFVQEGEFQYATLDAAVANYATAPFTTLLAQDLFIEIGRLAVVKNATDLSNVTQARFFVTGGGAAGSSGGGGSAVTSVTGTTNEISVSAPVGAVQVGLPATLTFTGKTVTGGTYNSGSFNGTVGATTPSTGAFTTLNVNHADAAFVTNINGVTGKLRLVGYFDATIGALLESNLANLSANLPLTLNATNTRITSSGALIGLFSSTGLAVTGTISNIYTGATGNSITNSSDTSGTAFLSFKKADTSTIGSIIRVGTTDAVAYNTTSDGRLKTNIRTFTAADSGPIIDGLRPVWFDWKASQLSETVMQDSGEKDIEGKTIKKPVLVPVKDPKRIAKHQADAKGIIGFIAQEEAAVSPALVRTGAVTVGDSNPDKIEQQWQRSDAALIPILVAEIKALRARVAALEAQATKP